jgi:hypothetical protein
MVGTSGILVIMALGTDIGLRYDVTIGVRFDFGFKPIIQQMKLEKWFREYNFANSVLKYKLPF